ncbi:DUF4437 domain-containing protein [Neolewinella aurantiaca]|uniref:DUF4437 domain-containing protein n=1 Tax=Neolewinella aurantiaca TaxID=2602767 RepID=A0A5C7FH22_9BACT|nr:DUF4437 domain-containing protein [Neolewinella aurantiaca]TXF89043.1 DUF4437 domain-containing protein [Neolewinella aurantiaca]
MKHLIILILFVAFLTGCEDAVVKSNAGDTAEVVEPTNRIKLSSEIEWTPLNPARGDASPQAGTIWGDRSAEVATGFLVKFKEGFSSPPHIHNVTYRGTVIKGLIHNDDPDAAKMWMPAGSFWTQPAGEAHITAASAAENMAYIEIDHGPYLVKPTDEAFDEGERPLNIDESNIVWADVEGSGDGLKRSYLWGNPEGDDLYGMYLKLPAGFTGKVETSGSVFHAVVIGGEVDYTIPGEDKASVLDIGGYFTSTGASVHDVAVGSAQETVVYVRTNGAVRLSSAK